MSFLIPPFLQAVSGLGHRPTESSDKTMGTPAKQTAEGSKHTGGQEDPEASVTKRAKTAATNAASEGPAKRKAPTLEDASLAFQKEQCEEEVEKGRKRRKMNKKDDAATFSQPHTNFKNDVLSIILERCTEAGVTLRTTQTLLDSGKFAAEDLYCANPNHKVVEALEAKGTNAVRGVFTDALEEWDESAKFDVAYVDLCTGSADEVLKKLEAVLPRVQPESIVACTITGRAGTDRVPDGEHDKSWHSMGNRVQRIHAALDSAPYDYKHVAAFEGNSAGAARQMSEIYYGARGARVCTGIFMRRSVVERNAANGFAEGLR
jgi:hypothetical protein